MAETKDGDSVPRKSQSWIGDFSSLTTSLPSPPLFRKWSAIFTLAAALERRCYAKVLRTPIYPNLYVWLVGPPGSGKSVGISMARELMVKAGSYKLAPPRITRAGLEDALESARQTSPLVNGLPGYSYHHLNCFLPELGNFIPAHNTEFLNVLNTLYDNERTYEWQTRGQGDPVKINNPGLAMLGGVQPKFLSGLLPEEAWGMGITSRIIMVYQGASVKPALFQDSDIELWQEPIYKALVNDLTSMKQLEGPFYFHDKGKELIEQLYETNMLPVPTHAKLYSYLPRRFMNLVKLSMISSISRTNSMEIRQEDVENAFDLILEAEELMPQIFTEMSSGSHDDNIQEAWTYIFQEHLRTGKGVPESRLNYFLQKRVPAQMISFTIDAMFTSKMIMAEDTGASPGARLLRPLDLYKD